MDEKQYYEYVRKYFDEDAKDYLERYEKNYILRKMREDFRRITEMYDFTSALEVGCGPGIDLLYFGSKYPKRTFHGIDISPRMVEQARSLTKHLPNVRVDVGRIEDVHGKYSLVYSYFGALNTVYSLESFANKLYDILESEGVAVLTVINRFYLMDVVFNLMRLRFSKAFERISGRFQGYSPKRKLYSKPLSYGDIRRAFSNFQVILRKGYCITYPAWYRYRRFKEKLIEPLWKLDTILNRTPLWRFGEYALYVLKPKVT